MEVFSTPVCPMPMEEVSLSAANAPAATDQSEYEAFVAQFLSDIPGVPSQPPKTQELSNPASMTCLQQPPQQPLLDSFYENDETNDSGVSTVVNQELQSGFLGVWGQQQQEQQQQQQLDIVDEMEIDLERCSPEDKKLFSSLVKEELHCHLRLKLMKEGKDFVEQVSDNQTSVKEYEVSDETKEMQKKRKEKNREAAKKCRQKKKATEREQEMKIRATQNEVQRLKEELNRERRGFSSLLEMFPNMPCFLGYLRQNRHLLRNPLMKPALQEFVRAHGGCMSMTPGSRCHVCPVSQPAGHSSVEQ